MNRIKPQLILYRPSHYLDKPKACIKKRLYLSKFEFCEARQSFAQVKRISKARITKYIRKTHWNFIDVLQRKQFDVNIFHFFINKLNLSQIIVQGETGLSEFSEKEQRLAKRVFSQQKGLEKCKLVLYTRTLNRNSIKALFQVRNLKKLELLIVESTEEDLVLLKGFLQNVQRRKPWIATGIQKIKLEFRPIFERFDTMNDSDDEDEVNELFVQYFEKLLDLKDLVKETCTQLTLSLNFEDIRAKVRKETWTLLANAMKEVENIVEIQYSGDPQEEVAAAFKGLKDLKSLRRLHFDFQNNDFEHVLWESLGSIGDSLTDLTIKFQHLDCSKDWIKKLHRMPRLESLCLSGTVWKFDQRFFLQFSNCLKVMNDLRDLKIMLIFETGSSTYSKAPSVKQLLETIGGLAKLENLDLLMNHSSERFVDSLENEKLFEPLINLKNLKSLDYNFSTLKAGENEIKQLPMVLSQMKELKKLSLKFAWFENLEDQDLISIFKGIAQLKWLEKLDFQFSCSRIRNEFIGIFFEVVMGLKYLEEVDLNICQTTQNIQLGKDLKDVCKRLEIKKKIPIKLKMWESAEVEKKKKRQVKIYLLILVSFCIFLLSYFTSSDADADMRN